MKLSIKTNCHLTLGLFVNEEDLSALKSVFAEKSSKSARFSNGLTLWSYANDYVALFNKDRKVFYGQIDVDTLLQDIFNAISVATHGTCCLCGAHVESTVDSADTAVGYNSNGSIVNADSKDCVKHTCINCAVTLGYL